MRYNMRKKKPEKDVDCMTLEELKKKKKEHGFTNEQIAELSGVPLGTVQKIFAGITESPRYETLRALEKVFDHMTVNVIREAVTYDRKQQGEFRLDDYYALPEEQRAELIDGVLYDMSAPTSMHQLLSGQLYMRLMEYVQKNQGECIPLYAPIDVQLDRDDKTMVQPDVIVVCDRSKIINRCVFGAPDLVIEILSQSTRKKDMVTKLHKYSDAGVKEYWMIDSEKQKVIVYDFAHEEYMKLYGFDSKVPVGIFEGMCEIDFRVIYEYIKFLYEA